MERAHVTHDLIDFNLKIPDWLIKITFLVMEIKTVTKPGIKSRFGMGFSTSNAIWGLRFSLSHLKGRMNLNRLLSTEGFISL